MSEEDVRGGLLEAVADEPPLHFDPDELVATAKKQVRRRALVAVGVATVAVAVAAVAVPTVLGRGGDTTPVAEQPATRAPSSQAEQWPPSGVVPVSHTADELRLRGKQLTAHLQTSLPTTLPSASAFSYGEFGGEAAGDFHDGQASINAPVSFTIDGARYSIFITTWARGTAGSPSQNCVANCRRLGDQADGTLYVQAEDLGDGFIETIFFYRDNGSVVSVAAYNYDMASKVPPTYVPSLAVSRDQLLAVVTDPGLEL